MLGTVQYSMKQYIVVQYIIVKYSTVSPVQYTISTVQYCW